MDPLYVKIKIKSEVVQRVKNVATSSRKPKMLSSDSALVTVLFVTYNRRLKFLSRFRFRPGRSCRAGAGSHVQEDIRPSGKSCRRPFKVHWNSPTEGMCSETCSNLPISRQIRFVSKIRSPLVEDPAETLAETRWISIAGSTEANGSNWVRL